MNTRPLLSFVALAVGLLIGPPAGADGPAGVADGLRIGLQGSVSQWHIDQGVQLLGQNESMESDFEPTLGFVGQYVFDDGSDTGFFVGFEVDATPAGVSHEEVFNVGDVPVNVAADISWSMDLLWLMGYDFGKVSTMLAGGGSYMSGEITASGAGLTASDENSHAGWKVVPTVEIDLGRSSALMVRLGIGQYQTKKYTGRFAMLDSDVDIDVEPRTIDVRVAWVYRVGSLFSAKQ